jgi:hypothetical protein
MFCWHKWTKWEANGHGVIRKALDNLTERVLDEKERYDIGYFEQQRRVCEKCGKSELRRAEVSVV